MRKCLFFCSYGSLHKSTDIFGLLERTAALGCSEAELYPFGPLAGDDCVEQAKSVREACDRLGISNTCFSLGITPLPNPLLGEGLSKQRESVEIIKRYIDVCEVLGAPFLHHTLFLNYDKREQPLFGKMLPAAVEVCREACNYAGEKGISCVYENHGYLFNASDRFEQFFTALDMPNAHINFDLGNILFVDEAPEVFIGKLACYIKHVHVKDYIRKPAGLQAGRGFSVTLKGDYLLDCVVGQGVIDFQRCLRLLILSGYNGSFSLEYCGNAEPVDSIMLCFENLERAYDQALKECAGTGSVITI